MSSSSNIQPLLEPGAQVDTLRIAQVLGRGTFSASYLASDPLQGQQVVLKEYFPKDCAERQDNGSVRARAGREAEYRAGLELFLSEGRMLAGLQHPHIVEALRCFEARGTAWMLLPWQPGELLSHKLEREGPLARASLEALVFPLLDALLYLHRNGVFHQDIKPANIFLGTDGQPVLLDFGSASWSTASNNRQSAHRGTGSLGYAAPEQQAGVGSIGAWTDIYAFAATLYRSVTGHIPPAALQRLEAQQQGQPDPLARLSGPGSPLPAGHKLPGHYLQAIDAGLILQADRRPRRVADWARMFAGPGAMAQGSGSGKNRRNVPGANQPSGAGDTEFASEGRAWLPLALLGVLVAAIGVLLFYLFTGTGPGAGSEQSRDAPTPSRTEQVADSRDPELNRRWLDALEADTIFGYQQFRQDYPQSIHEADAKMHLARLDDELWQTLDAEGTRSGYESYLEQLPEGRHAADARIRLDMLDRTAAEAERQRELRAQQDNLAWNEARMQRSIAAVDRYLAEFPDGQHVEAAQALRRQFSDAANEGSAFAAAQKLNTRQAYQSYIDAFPRGQHVTAALMAIDNLTLRPGKRFRDCDACPDLVVLEAGTFWQGAEEDSTAALANEKPQRKVVLQKDFAIGIHEVTAAQWDACAADGACPATPDNGWGRGARPVIMVSWNEAQDYVDWLSQKTGEKYRLPSESEWEYAARAGETDEWPEGDPAYVCSLGNIAGSETGFRWAHAACADPFALETAPVGSFPANSFGIQDSIGNVAEWTLDCMSLSYHDAPVDGSASSRGLCNSRVTRGGSWFSGARESRLTARFNLKAGDRNDFTGFRVVRELGPGS